ncbi:MAG: site-specific integrase [Methanococcoides sp.]|nr:site-specific integrase [Methanococcoides sp.]
MKYAKNWLTPDEIKRIMQLPNLKEKYEIWVLLLYVPALRVSEALNVKVRDLHLETETIDVWGGKGHDSSELSKVHCPGSIIKRIKRYAEHSDLKPSSYIMFSQCKPQASSMQVYRVVNELCAKAGIDKKIGTHTFRRSRAEHLLDQGLPITHVSRYLRHKNLATTMKYLNVSVADLQNELTKIGDNVEVIV